MITRFYIETTDRAITFVPWEVQNTLPDGQTNMEIDQKVNKVAPTTGQIHEIMVVINDVMKDAGLTTAFLLGIKKLFQASGGKTRLRIKVGGKITRDLKGQIDGIGCEVEYDKE